MLLVVVVCAAALAVWLAVLPGALRRSKAARYVGLAGALLVVLGVGVVVVGSNAQLPGPTSIASPGLDDLATHQARQDVNSQIVRVVCPRGTFAPGSAVVCAAHYPKRSQPLNVKLRRAGDGGLYVDVHGEQTAHR